MEHTLEITHSIPIPQTSEDSALTMQHGLALSPFCRELRSKKFYFLQEMPTQEQHLLDATNHCWCLRTMQAIGPDGERVHASDCKPDRPCYKSLFAEE